MEDFELEQLTRELLRIPGETAVYRVEISRLAARRRELAVVLNDAIGPTLAAKRLGISRQTFWQVLNPEKAQAIKRRSSRSRHEGVAATTSEAT
jgi:transcriptional regulator of aromatic amino acid metabolism